jgi:hypothetical protein
MRPLSTLEKLHWLLDQNHHNHFPMAVEVKGKIDVETWRIALDRLQQRHPLLNACIRLDGGNPVFQYVEGTRIPCRVKRLTSSFQWESEFEREITTPFNAQAAPLIRAVLLEGNDHAQIILTAHHAIADGMSMLFLLRDLLCAAAGTMLAPLPVPPSQDELLESMLKKFPQQNSAPRAERPPRNQTMGLRPKSDAKPTVKGMRLSPQQTTLLVSRARRENTTVHAALCAALALAGGEKCAAWRRDGVQVLSPISLRKLLGVNADCVLALSAGNIRLEPVPGISVWELARQAKQALLPFQSPEGLASMSSAIGTLVSQGREKLLESITHEMSYDLVVTNVQRAPFGGPLGSLTVEALWGPSALNGLEGEQAISAATVNDSLCLVHTSYTPFESFLSRAVELLMDACRDEQTSGQTPCFRTAVAGA